MIRRPYETLSSFQRTISSSLRCKEIETAYFALEEGGNEGFLLHVLTFPPPPSLRTASTSGGLRGISITGWLGGGVGKVFEG